MSVFHGVGIFSAVVLVASAVGAKAGGYGSIKDAPPPPEVYQWNGLSVGAGIGAGRIGYDFDVSARCSERFDDMYDIQRVVSVESFARPRCPPPVHKSFGDDDWNVFGTVQVAYDRLIHDRILIGAFADFDFYPDGDSTFSSGGRGGGPGPGPTLLFAPPPSPTISGNLDLDNVWSVGLRLGYLVTPRVLLYGVGGYTQAQVEGSVTANLGPAGSVTAAFDDNMSGWFIGAGAELKLRKDVSLKFEYRYADYGNNKFAETAGGFAVARCFDYCAPAHTTSVDGDLDLTIHTARVVLVLKLGDMHERAPAPLK